MTFIIVAVRTCAACRMHRLYNTALLFARPVVLFRAAWTRLRGRDGREWAERRARVLPRVPGGGVWIHGASVGEARLVRSLARTIRDARPELPLAASCTTRTGRSVLPSPPEVDAAFFAPLDFPGCPGRVLDALRPAALALVETELWPNLLREAHRKSVPVIVVNARLAPERMHRYRRIRWLLRPLLRELATVAVQSPAQLPRFREMGVPEGRIVVSGNLKYDLPAPRVSEEEARARFGLEPTRPVVAAGSTARGEDGPILDAFLQARREFPRLYLILAPRHPERAGEVRAEAERRGLRLHPLSFKADARAGKADGLLVDRVGELAGLYVPAWAAFVGGSLVPVGGHNVLEPAAAAVPVLFGPHTGHVAEPARELEQRGGARRVRSDEELAQVWIELLRDPRLRRRMAKAAREVVQVNRGALERTVHLMLAVVDRRRTATGTGGAA